MSRITPNGRSPAPALTVVAKIAPSEMNAPRKDGQDEQARGVESCLEDSDGFGFGRHLWREGCVERPGISQLRTCERLP
jgi:hypothetical protein